MDYRKITFEKEEVDATVLSGVRNFEPGKIFDCGQAFRFSPVAGTPHEQEWGGVALGKYISAALDGDRVTLYNVGEDDFAEKWERYFALDLDYALIDREILSGCSSPRLAEAVAAGNGIRVLRQDPWEALCSFIISQNNNIPRIRSLVARLCEEAGDEVDTSRMRNHGAPEKAFSFPSVEKVAAVGEERLKRMHMGFRAGYIASASASVAAGRPSLEEVANAPSTQEASALLQSLRGVGPKVAACTLLFGFSRLDAFPVDVWIKRVIVKYFPGCFSPDMLGRYAGIAQQYLFWYERLTDSED